MFYEARGVEISARHDCLYALVTDLAEMHATRLVIESRESQDWRDRQTIAVALRKMSGELPYVHALPHTEPGLWWPDAMAWAFGVGGQWKSLVEGLIGGVHDAQGRR